MPYIEWQKRERARFEPRTSGELNFCVTETIIDYLDGRTEYAALNEVIGVLEAVKLEFYRRMVAPYEDRKIVENGDVYRSVVDWL